VGVASGEGVKSEGVPVEARPSGPPAGKTVWPSSGVGVSGTPGVDGVGGSPAAI